MSKYTANQKRGSAVAIQDLMKRLNRYKKRYKK